MTPQKKPKITIFADSWGAAARQASKTPKKQQRGRWVVAGRMGRAKAARGQKAQKGEAERAGAKIFFL